MLQQVEWLVCHLIVSMLELLLVKDVMLLAELVPLERISAILA